MVCDSVWACREFHTEPHQSPNSPPRGIAPGNRNSVSSEIGAARYGTHESVSARPVQPLVEGGLFRLSDPGEVAGELLEVALVVRQADSEQKPRVALMLKALSAQEARDRDALPTDQRQPIRSADGDSPTP